MAKNDTLILIPTYNEADNVRQIFEEIRRMNLPADILFVDDNSPDGTGRIIDELAQSFPGVQVLHRRGKQGIGSAHLAGIRRAYDRQYRLLVTMDCDFTHSPSYILDFLKYAEDGDVVVGSRYLQDNSLASWNPFRKTLTYLGHFMTKTLLSMPYDASGAFRLYNLERIKPGFFSLVSSPGYSFFFESLFLLNLNGYRIREIPIDLPARTYGHSKMTVSDAWGSLSYLWRIFLKKLFNRESMIYRDSEVDKTDIPEAEKKVEQEWDIYWGGKDKSPSLLYDLIARFYRKYIIMGALDHFIRKHFSPGAGVLHAGCGSGQVDEGVVRHVQVTALDISQNALKIYKSIHGDRCKIVHGSIFNLPFPDNTFDGIYNLGVMEHFTEEEIHKILLEFHRVLRPGGKIVLFWPPVFGLTVNVLDAVHFVLNRILKKNVKLHPDEVTRVRSRQHVTSVVTKAGFEMTEYYFGLRDLFTQSVIVARKKTG